MRCGFWIAIIFSDRFLQWNLQLRCTYRAYDAMDEITAAFSVAFNPAGTK